MANKENIKSIKSYFSKLGFSGILLLVGTVGVYGVVRKANENYTRSQRIYERFLENADTDKDGLVSLADQEAYLIRSGIELKTTKVNNKQVIQYLPFSDMGKYLNAHPAIGKELDELEAKLSILPVG